MPYVINEGGAMVWEAEARPAEDIQIEHPVVGEVVLDDKPADVVIDKPFDTPPPVEETPPKPKP